MPAIMTHDLFGRDLLEQHADYAVTNEERDAFLLGCQGPDPLFYIKINPATGPWKPLGTIMHTEKPSVLLAALRKEVDALPEDEHALGLAYARGFVAHYALDTQVHPLVYAQEFALCDAGIEGLTHRDGRYVHATIETTLDEMVLYTKRSKTVEQWRPYRQILNSSDEVLRIISGMYARMVQATYALEPHETLYAQAVECFRIVQRVFYSPTGELSRKLGLFERAVRRHSLIEAMSHRATTSLECAFDNHEHDAWVNPFTKQPSTEDFWSLYDQALNKALQAIEVFEAPTFDLAAAEHLTQGMNFDGEPVE